jgi:hypothetical protein
MAFAVRAPTPVVKFGLASPWPMPPNVSCGSGQGLTPASAPLLAPLELPPASPLELAPLLAPLEVPPLSPLELAPLLAPLELPPASPLELVPLLAPLELPPPSLPLLMLASWLP